MNFYERLEDVRKHRKISMGEKVFRGVMLTIATVILFLDIYMLYAILTR